MIRCAECHKYFVSRHKNDKYCDSATRKPKNPKKDGCDHKGKQQCDKTPSQNDNCSYKGKQRREKEKAKYVRQLYNLKRNQAARLKDTVDYLDQLTITNKSDVTTEFMKFMFYLKQTILKDYIYDKERSFIYRHLADSSSQKEQAELKSYGVAFFPTAKSFKLETPECLPNSNNHICIFFNIEESSFIDDSHIISFDWSDMLQTVIKDNLEPHKKYIDFREKMIKSAKRYPSLFYALPSAITESLLYLNSIDDKWQELIDILPTVQIKSKSVRRR